MKPKTIEISTFEEVYVESTHSYHEVENHIFITLYLKVENDPTGEPYQCEICEKKVGCVSEGEFIPYTMDDTTIVCCLPHTREEILEMLGVDLMPQKVV